MVDLAELCYISTVENDLLKMAEDLQIFRRIYGSYLNE